MTIVEIVLLEAISKMLCHCEESCFIGRRSNLSLVRHPSTTLRAARNDNDILVFEMASKNIVNVMFNHVKVTIIFHDP